MQPAASERPLRADARRNRQKVLAAGRRVFAEQGREAQMDDVARGADVGVGTVYRHFPTKEALLEALTDEVFADVAAFAEAALEQPDPWEAFLSVLWYGGEKTSGDRAFSEIMAAGKATRVSCPGQESLYITVGELMRRAQGAGRMRPDASVDDIPLVMCGVGSASGLEHPCPDAWRRHLGIVLDGLRAEAASRPLHCE